MKKDDLKEKKKRLVTKYAQEWEKIENGQDPSSPAG